MSCYTKGMKISAPRLPVKLEEVEPKVMMDELSLEDASIADVDLTSQVISALDISGGLFQNVILTGAQFERLNARDFVAKQSDFSAGSLTNSSLNRAEFKNCRMTGVDFSRTTLHDVSFHGCKLDMANFRFADLARVQFVDCTLSETDFLGAGLRDVSMQACTLQKTVFEQAKCKQLDLRTSHLEEIIGWKSLKGAIIDDLQLVSAGPYLAHELGIVVRP